MRDDDVTCQCCYTVIDRDDAEYRLDDPEDEDSDEGYYLCEACSKQDQKHSNI